MSEDISKDRIEEEAADEQPESAGATEEKTDTPAEKAGPDRDSKPVESGETDGIEDGGSPDEAAVGAEPGSPEKDAGEDDSGGSPDEAQEPEGEDEPGAGAEKAEEMDPAKAEEPAVEPNESAPAPAGAGAPSAAQAPEPEKSKRRWYVLHTYSGRENKVRETIERLIKASDFKDEFGKVLVATEEVAEMKKGKKKVSKRKLFPSYILIEMEMTNETWNLIENVPGVTHFVGGGKKPFPIPKKEVDRILGRMEKKEGIIPEVPFTLGEHVSVVDGPFADFTGVVDEINPERGKVKVLVSIFGRETPVELDFLQVKAI